MPIISDLTGVKREDRILAKCDNPDCDNIWETNFHGKRTHERKIFLCRSCCQKDFSWRTNPAILTLPHERRKGKSFIYQCEKCKRIFEAIYRGKKTEERHPFLCLECSTNARQITKWNPAILTPPEQRRSEHPVVVQCEDCKTVYTYKCYSRKLEERIPWLCDKCSSRRQGFKNKGHKNTLEQKERKRQMRIGKRHSEETKKKIGISNRKPKFTLQQRQELKLLRKAQWQDSEYIKKVFNGFKRKGIRGYSSKPQEWLFELVRQYYSDTVINEWLAGKVPDITINSEMLIVEYDCFYWHQDKRGKDLQTVRLFLLNGYRVLRFFVYGQEQYDADFYLREIKKFIRSKKQVAIIEVNKPEEDIEEVDAEQITLF